MPFSFASCLLLIMSAFGCENRPISLEEYESSSRRVLTFDLQDAIVGEFPVSQEVNGFVLVIDGLIAKSRESESGEPDNVYAFGLGNPGFTATLRLADKSGSPALFSVQSLGVSNNNQFKPGPAEPPRCPVFAKGLRGDREIFKDYPIGPSYGLAGQFNTFRFRRNDRIDTLVLKAEATGKDYYPCFDDFVFRVDFVGR